MALTNVAKHTLLSKLVGKALPDHTITHLSLHTDSPGTTGANEVVGGDPAYSRVSVTEADFDAPSGGEVQLNNDKQFNGPDSGAATHWGIWDGTDFLGYGSIAGDTSFNSSGEFVLQTGTKIVVN